MVLQILCKTTKSWWNTKLICSIVVFFTKKSEWYLLQNYLSSLSHIRELNNDILEFSQPSQCQVFSVRESEPYCQTFMKHFHVFTFSRTVEKRRNICCFQWRYRTPPQDSYFIACCILHVFIALWQHTTNLNLLYFWWSRELNYLSIYLLYFIVTHFREYVFTFTVVLGASWSKNLTYCSPD